MRFSALVLVVILLLAAQAWGLTDTDGDGLTDTDETGIYGTDPMDADSDNDGLNDYAEVMLHSTSPVDADTDDDGLGDGEEPSVLFTDPLLFDTDGDGLGDGQEAGRTTGRAAGTSEGAYAPTRVSYLGTNAAVFVPDANPASTTDPLDGDSDNDSVVDGTEDRDHDGVVDFTETDPLLSDSDGDNIDDGVETNGGQMIDTDGDGLIDALDTDSDSDTVLDQNEGTADSDGDGQPDFRDADDDGDGLQTAVEGGTADTDGDGVLNYLDTDSDGDGYFDGDPLEGLADDDLDGIPNYLDFDSPVVDTDGDGLSDTLEASLGTNPNLADSDADNIDDFTETNEGQFVDTDSDGLIDALDPDCDGDSVPDLIEGLADHDGDLVPDYRDDDDDDDTILTIVEGTADVDADGVPNYLDIDSDDDGFTDAEEAAVGADPYDRTNTPLTIHDPALTAIGDVGNDQGGRVRLRWASSDLDAAGSSQPILSYSVYRRIDANKAAQTGFATHAKVSGAWDFVLNLPATGETAYSTLAGTLCDSTSEGVCWSVFFVRAHTAVPTAFHDSDPDSGYSVDNLAPNAPAGLVVAYGADNVLHWQASAAVDFRYFRIYRGPAAGFTPDAAHLLQTLTGTEWSDPDAGYGVYYMVSAVDFAGNESQVAVPMSVSGVGDRVPTVAALDQNAPNPFNPSTTIGFALNRSEAVTLAIHDLSGRLVRTLLAGETLPAGTHHAVWDGRDAIGRPVGAGVYFYSVRTATFADTKRMALIK